MIVLISYHNKYSPIFVLGDFNIYFLKYDMHPLTNKFLDSLPSHYFLLHILQPKRVNSNYKTRTGDTFSNMTVPNMGYGNLPAFI